MDITEISVLFLGILSIVLLLNLRNRVKTNSSKRNLPPGPWKLPIIGNLHQLASSVPHRVMRDLAKQFGPLMHLQLGEVSTIVVSSPEVAKQVMKTHDINFASRPHIMVSQMLSYDSTNIAFSPYGEYWRMLRKIAMLELFSTNRVKSFRSIREDETLNLMRCAAGNEGKPINLTEKINTLVFSSTSRAAFGKKNEEQETFITLIKEGMRLAGGFNVADIYPSIKLLHRASGLKSMVEKNFKQTDRILGNIVNDHKTGRGTKNEYSKDLVDVLLKYHEDENSELQLTDNNIKAVLLDIFAAGGDTSATTIDWAMSEMLRNKSILNKAQDEVREAFRSKGYVDEQDLEKLKYLKAIIKETLRLHPPVPLLLPRHNSERCVIDGYEIPEKTKLLVNVWAIHRDSRYWDDAECFEPERFVDSSIDYKGTHFEYIPFGAGRRMCPGMTFGLANVELPLAKMLYHFDWSLPHGILPEELDMTEDFGLTVRRKDDLRVIPTIVYDLPPQ